MINPCLRSIFATSTCQRESVSIRWYNSKSKRCVRRWTISQKRRQVQFLKLLSPRKSRWTYFINRMCWTPNLRLTLHSSNNLIRCLRHNILPLRTNSFLLRAQNQPLNYKQMIIFSRVRMTTAQTLITLAGYQIKSLIKWALNKDLLGNVSSKNSQSSSKLYTRSVVKLNYQPW